ncbi:MAG: exosortase/archaeosortase family protein [Desulfobacteraceae bacterium]|nr:exosortase/archaeosortase family protein [Desulfobacteraceae bacterium]MCF8094800.1 exosortase/archaeosortase family protein [Desulfobacteraceae bacterium]
MKTLHNPVSAMSSLSPFSYWVKAAVVFALWALVFLPVYPELWHTWMNNANNSHGVLVPVISAVLIWSKREQLVGAPIRVSNYGALLLAASLGIYLLVLAGHVAVAQRAMIVFTLMGLVLFNFGRDVFKILAFPLAYLLFMIPVPISIYNLIAFPLQLFVTDVSRVIIQTVQIPVFQEGNMLYFAQAQLEVAEACSGIRSMTAFVMLGVLFAYLMDKGWLRRGILVLSAIPLAVAVNILRVAGTGILAHFYGEQVARGFLHEFSGLIVFAFGFILMLAGYLLLNQWGRKDPSDR